MFNYNNKKYKETAQYTWLSFYFYSLSLRPARFSSSSIASNSSVKFASIFPISFKTFESIIGADGTLDDRVPSIFVPIDEDDDNVGDGVFVIAVIPDIVPLLPLFIRGGIDWLPTLATVVANDDDDEEEDNDDD